MPVSASNAMVDQSAAPARPGVVRVALAHDWVVGYRGGEAVLEAIATIVQEHFEPGGFYTMFATEHGLAAMRAARRGRPAKLESAAMAAPVVSRLSRWPGGAGRLRRWLLPLYPLAVEELSARLAEAHARSPIGLVISTSSAAIKGLRPPPGVPHVCYCHAPARYLWSQASEYGRGRAGRLRTAGLGVFGPRLREWDRRTAANVTRFVANSTHTAREIARCYEREAEVVFPPVDTEFYTPDPAEGRGDHWLYAGALEPYKRVDLVIEAANRVRQPLVIVGGGSQDAHLRTIAGPSVKFLGRVDDESLRREYRRARLLVFPQVEDFGIVAAEALACGTPVLAFAAGGALDMVTPGRTGMLFEEATAEALIDAAARVPTGMETAAACRASAERFSMAVFAAAMLRQIEATLQTRPT